MNNGSRILPEGLLITGTIDQESYKSMGKYMITLRTKVIFFGIMAAVIALCAGLGIYNHDLTCLLPIGLVLFFGVRIYRSLCQRIIATVISRMPEIRDGKQFDLEITFAEEAVHVYNRNTDKSTAFDYSIFNSYAETDSCVALFVKTGTYLLVPRSNMKPEQQEEMLRIMQEKCPRLRRRK